MNYKKFCEILNKHIFEGEKKELLRKIVENPERFVGLFRPTKPHAKILQHLFQSHEIRMGDALEEIVEEILKELNFETLPKSIQDEKGKQLSLDQYFTDNIVFYFIEQKIRDDHDSSKKRGQILNFETKLEILSKIHKSKLIGIMYFVDPDLSKNKNYYLYELLRLEKFYGVKLFLFYGKEFFEYLKVPEIWEQILNWLKQWKDSLPELPEINFDVVAEESYQAIRDLELRTWRKFCENEILWREGIVQTIFKEGTTLRLLLKFFERQDTFSYQQLKNLLIEKLKTYYGKIV